jgi:MbtH protein
MTRHRGRADPAARHRATSPGRGDGMPQLSSPGFETSVLELYMSLAAGAAMGSPSSGPLLGDQLAAVLDIERITLALIPPAALATIPAPVPGGLPTSAPSSPTAQPARPCHHVGTQPLHDQLEGESDMDDDTRYQVLRNDEDQYSLWPADHEVPEGWYQVGKEGTKDECSAYVDEVWTDMRPRSLRERMDAGQGS